MPEFECKAFFKIGTFPKFRAESEVEAIELVREGFLAEDVYDAGILTDFTDPTDSRWRISCRMV